MKLTYSKCPVAEPISEKLSHGCFDPKLLKNTLFSSPSEYLEEGLLLCLALKRSLIII